MTERENVIRRIKTVLQLTHTKSLTVTIPRYTAELVVSMLEEQEAMVKPTKCPCGELFDAKDSSFCPKCGCAYSELSGRYTNIGR